VKLIVRDERGRQAFVDFVRKVDLKKPFSAIFEPVKQKRSLPQNKLFHVWMQVLEGDTGTSCEAWKQHYKELFLSKFLDNCFGKEVITVQGTSDLDSGEFSNFLEKVRQDALENGSYLPWPDELGYEEMIIKYGG
jgi:hypothetical protein